jgi:hypothetical protein
MNRFSTKTGMATSLAVMLFAGVFDSARAADTTEPRHPHATQNSTAAHHLASPAASTATANTAQENRRARQAAQRKRALSHHSKPPIHNDLSAPRELEAIKAQNKMNERQRELDRAQQHAGNPDIGRAKQRFDDSQVDLQRVQPLP